MNSTANDAQRLKIAGLILMALGLVAMGVIGEWIDDGRKLLSGETYYLVLVGGAWIIAAYFFAIGMIVLLAGLKNVPLLTSTRARRGAWRKLAGATLLILCFAYVGLMDLPAFKTAEKIWWIEFFSLAAFLISARVGFQWLRNGWKYDVPSVEDLAARDPRPPVVYLRSFEADSEIVLRPEGFWRRWMMIFIDYAVTFSPEQELAEVLNAVGPVIAIGKPGEALPELGAARLYVSDAEWRAKVIDMMDRSRLVIIRTGSTSNLRWEIEQTMGRVPRRQILFVSFGDAKKTSPFDQYFEQRFGPINRSTEIAATPFWTRWYSVGKYVNGRIIYFDGALQPREVPIRLTLSLPGLALGLMRPYRDSIQSAMRRVFSSLDLPWISLSSQTTAVLLAMFGGMFGIHHFYLGNRRRGFKHLAFFWTAVPMFMGLYDSVKLARLESQEFEKKYSPRQELAGASFEALRDSRSVS